MLDYLKKAQLLRSTYYFVRIMDDVLDGDLLMAGDPAIYVFCFLQQAKSGILVGRNTAARLGHHVYRRIDRLDSNCELLTGYLNTLTEAMLFDRKRSRRGLLLSSLELRGHQLQTLESAHNAAFYIAGVHTRARDISHLIRAQAILTTLRNLKADLSRGLVNIPVDVVTLAQSQGAADLSYEELIPTSAVREWLAGQLAFGTEYLEAAGRMLTELKDRRVLSLLGPLYRDLQILAERLHRILGVDVPVLTEKDWKTPACY